MVGVIKVYGDGQGRRSAFYVKEDDRVVEPFEYKELFAVTESELRRAATRDKFVQQKVQFELANTEGEIDKSNDLIAQLVRQADLNEHDASEIRTAAREALDNAYRHGNLCQSNRRITVAYFLDNENVTITVKDEGKGFDYNFYLSLGKESDPEQRARIRAREGKPGGLGIMLMMRCLTTLEYDPPGSVCRLIKKIS
jgi:serine/threonine-protein kinase RsbW